MKRAPAVKEFTKAQRAAVERFGRDLCVKAGAGSGKTTILVERFLHAVTGKGAQPEKILAITFTEKAANEMKTRLVESCRDRSLHELRRRLEGAVISTIHSFCAKVLRENPVEAGVDPAFRVLGEGEADLLADKVLDRIFEEAASNERWIALLADYGEEALRGALKHFYDLGRTLGGEEAFLRAAEPGNAARARARIAQKAREIQKREDAGKSVALPKLKEWAARVPEWAEKAASGGWEAIRLYRELWSLKPRKSTAVRDDLNEIEALFEAWVACEADRLAAPSKREFAALCRRYREAVDAEKKRLAAYDFEDLLYLTWELLAGTSPARQAVRRRLAASYSYILVDEFQDTSALQVKIIDCLRREGNYFVVGDPQQSIYSFRHAAPEILEGIGASAKKGGFDEIVLSDNFRSRGEILAFVNGVFKGLFPESRFRPLTAGKTFGPPSGPPVEMLCVMKDGDERKMEGARIEEAARLARRLGEIAAASGLRFGDIAVLFRRADSMRYFEKAFFDAGIPYYVVKGKGFYEKQEVLDILNFLRLLQDPRQDIPLAAVLRSPLVRVSDDALLWLARAAKREDGEKPLWDAVRQDGVAELSAEDRAKLERFRGLLGGLRREKNRLPVSTILERLLAATHYEAKLLTQPGGRQMLANVRKLSDLARASEEKGISSADDFILFVKSLSEAETVEAEAVVQSEESDSVKLLTVHKAKGLEFGCVVVADMGGKADVSSREIFLADVERGLGMKLKDPSAPEMIMDAAFRAIAEKQKAAASEEEDRILYVAMTRAKERLILSGALKPSFSDGKSAAVTWMEKVALRAGALGTGVPATETAEAAGQARPAAPRRADDQALRAALLEGRPLKDAELERIGWAADASATARFKKALEPVQRAYTQTLDLSVTDLLTDLAQDDEEKRECLEESVLPEDPEGEEGLPRNEYGTIFHRLMEYLVSARPAKIVLTPLIKAWLAPLGDKERQEMLDSAQTFWKGPWGDALRRSKRAYAELPFIYKTPSGVLKGQIDLVFQSARGEWIVLDHKTNRFAPAGKEALARHYAFQLALYALVFRELYGESPRRGVLYFASTGEASERVYQEDDFRSTREKLDALFRGRIKSLDLFAGVLQQ